MSKNNKNNPLTYVLAAVLTFGLALPLALATQKTSEGMFDECFGDICNPETRRADLTK